MISQRLLFENPIVVSGMGAFSAAGATAGEHWKNVYQGKSPAVWQEYAWGRQSWRTAVCKAAVIGDRLGAFPRSSKWDRSIQLAVIAAAEAFHQAGLDRENFDSDRVGIVLGTSRGPRTKWMEFIERETVFPSDASASTIASMSGVLVQCFGISGPTFSVSATCASGGAAVVLAAQQILLGAADIMLVGGADAPLNDLMIAQLRAAGVVGHHEEASKTCRPFDRSRNGLCLGEGAGFLVLESPGSSIRRGSRSLARLGGWGLGTENVGRVAVDSQDSTLVRTMRSAIGMAGIAPSDIGYINAHGTGTVLNDKAEANAITEVFGAPCPPISSTKPITGHCLGATPLLESVIAIKALENQTLPPTANCEHPEFPLDVVPLHPRPAHFQHVLSNSLGFWGSHSTLLFSKIEQS